MNKQIEEIIRQHLTELVQPQRYPVGMERNTAMIAINGRTEDATKAINRIVLETKLEELENNKWHPNEATWIVIEANRVEDIKRQLRESEETDNGKD